jgi:hypothetical protein
MTRNYTELLSKINSKLPDLTYLIRNDSIQLTNGTSLNRPTTGAIYAATLTDRLLNTDFNNDGLPDAAVILNVIWTGIGYFSNIVYVVLQD